MPLDFTLEYAITKIQANQESLKLNGTHLFLVYADDDSTFGGCIHTIQKKRRTLIVPGKEIGLEVNAVKTKYMVMFPDQNAGKSQYKD